MKNTVHWRYHAPWFQTVLQSFGNQDSMELTEKQTQNSMGQNWQARNKPTRMWRIQFSSVAQLCLALCDPMDSSTPGFTVHHQLPELTQTQVHQVGDAIQLSHPLSSPSSPTFNLSQHQGLSQWVCFSHQVASVLELQLQRKSFQCIFRTDFL